MTIAHASGPSVRDACACATKRRYLGTFTRVANAAVAMCADHAAGQRLGRLGQACGRSSAAVAVAALTWSQSLAERDAMVRPAFWPASRTLSLMSSIACSERERDSATPDQAVSRQELAKHESHGQLSTHPQDHLPHLLEVRSHHMRWAAVDEVCQPGRCRLSHGPAAPPVPGHHRQPIGRYLSTVGHA